MEHIRHIFFDLDNTLWDFRKNSELALQQMFVTYKVEEKTNVDFDTWHTVYYHKNEELWAALRDKIVTKEGLRERRFKETFAQFNVFDAELNRTFETEYLEKVTDYNHLVKNAKELLDYLKPKYNLHILTNGFNEVSYRKIGNAKIDSYFKTITTADELGCPKPDARIFAHALNKANAKPEETIYIGDDWTADIIGSKAFGMDAIFFNALNEEILDTEVLVVDDLIKITEHL